MERFAVVLPTRGDRPQFLNHALHQLKNQSIQPEEIFIVNDPPKGNEKDITKRYKLGVQRALAKNHNIIFFIEDDDWYHPRYLETMLNKWKEAGKPPTFGINDTYYYHIGIHKYLYMKHPGRSSMFCTMVTDSISRLKWPNDRYAFVDMKLWKQIPGKTFSLGTDIIAIGIKHGIGLTGGGGHTPNFKWSHVNQQNWFRGIIGEESFNFYNSINVKTR